jgi:hypothetical protein
VYALVFAMVKLIIVQLKQLEHLHSLTRVVPEQNGSLVIGLAIICTPLLQLKKNCRWQRRRLKVFSLKIDFLSPPNSKPAAIIQNDARHKGRR